MFHVSPSSVRPMIQSVGLIPRRPNPALGQPSGVYLWDEEEFAERFQAEVEGDDYRDEPHDLWWVDVSGLRLKQDPYGNEWAEHSFYCESPIGPERLERL